MSKPLPGSAVTTPRCKQTKSAATNAMLLSVSFYVIFTTLPATVVYVLYAVFPEGPYLDPSTCRPVDMALDATWRRHVIYQLVTKIVNELCLSHYACNFIVFAVTGLEFRRELVRVLCRRRDDRRASENGATEYTLTAVTPGGHGGPSSSSPPAAGGRARIHSDSRQRDQELRAFVQQPPHS